MKKNYTIEIIHHIAFISLSIKAGMKLINHIIFCSIF